MPKNEKTTRNFALRLDSETMEAIEKWAADEFRSTNGQILYLLDQALKKSGRKKKKEKGGGGKNIIMVFGVGGRKPKGGGGDCGWGFKSHRFFPEFPFGGGAPCIRGMQGAQPV